MFERSKLLQKVGIFGIEKANIYYATTFGYVKPHCHPRLVLVSGDAELSE